MADGEVVGGEVDAAGVDEAVQIRLVGIVDDLLIAVVFHHDQEDVIEMGDAAGMVLLSESDGGQRHGEETQCCFSEHEFRTSPDWILGIPATRGSAARARGYCAVRASTGASTGDEQTANRWKMARGSERGCGFRVVFFIHG